MQSKNKKKAAFFVDAENVTRWLQGNYLQSVLNALSADYDVVIRKAYADWTNKAVQAHQANVNRFGFDFVHCMHSIESKNSVDMHMAVDIIQCSLVDTDIDCFAIMTGDADFSPVFRRLRTLKKEVIAVCHGKTSLAQDIRNSCHRVIDLDEEAVQTNTVVPFSRFHKTLVSERYMVKLKRMDINLIEANKIKAIYREAIAIRHKNTYTDGREYKRLVS